MDNLLHSPPSSRTGEMIGFDLWTESHARARRGEAKQKMARELGVDRPTVRRLLAQERPMPYQRTVTRPSIVQPYLDYIQHRVMAVDCHAYRIFQELKAQGYAWGSEMVKLAVRPRRAERDRLAEATVRFETAPGRQAQVDWGSTWADIGGQRMRVQRFVRVLGYSRRLYVECTRDQTLGSLLACHQHAFDWFGGLTDEILYDNPKTVVLKRDWDGRVIEWHPQFWDFAPYHGFTPRLCRPYRAQTNGKVESGITYVKRSFVLGRQFPAWDALNPSARQWVSKFCAAGGSIISIHTSKCAWRPPICAVKGSSIATSHGYVGFPKRASIANSAPMSPAGSSSWNTWRHVGRAVPSSHTA
jgi:transposase